MILAAGLLLITPGILTDFVGFSLLVPPVRKWIRHKLARRFNRATAQYRQTDDESNERPHIIDVKIVKPEDSEKD